MADMERSEAGKPEHKQIHLHLVETEVPDFPTRLPAPTIVYVDNQSLIVQFEAPSDTTKALVFVADQIIRVRILGSHGSWTTATIEHLDPYEVVPAFRTTLGSREIYWIKAFGKMMSDKLGVNVEEIVYDEVPF